MQDTPLDPFEKMTCAELLEVLRLQYAIDAARRAGVDGCEMTFRTQLANLMNTAAVRA